MVNEHDCEIMMIHFKLFKGSDRLADIDSILDEADSIIQKQKVRRFPKFKLQDLSLSNINWSLSKLKSSSKKKSRKKSKDQSKMLDVKNEDTFNQVNFQLEESKMEVIKSEKTID